MEMEAEQLAAGGGSFGLPSPGSFDEDMDSSAPPAPGGPRTGSSNTARGQKRPRLAADVLPSVMASNSRWIKSHEKLASIYSRTGRYNSSAGVNDSRTGSLSARQELDVEQEDSEGRRTRNAEGGAPRRRTPDSGRSRTTSRRPGLLGAGTSSSAASTRVENGNAQSGSAARRMAASTGRETYGHQSDTHSASVQRELDKLFEYGVLIQQFLQENDALQIFFERNSHTFYAVPRVLKYTYSNLVRITAKDLLSATLNGALEDIGTMRRMVVRAVDAGEEGQTETHTENERYTIAGRKMLQQKRTPGPLWKPVPDIYRTRKDVRAKHGRKEIKQPALSCELFFAEDSPQVFLALNTDFPRELPTGPDGRWDIKPLRTEASLRGDADDLFDMSGFLFLKTENLEDSFSKWGLSRFAWRNLGLALMALAVLSMIGFGVSTCLAFLNSDARRTAKSTSTSTSFLQEEMRRPLADVITSGQDWDHAGDKFLAEEDMEEIKADANHQHATAGAGSRAMVLDEREARCSRSPCPAAPLAGAAGVGADAGTQERDGDAFGPLDEEPIQVERPGFLAIADKKLRFEEQERRLQQRLTTAGGRGAPAGDVAALQSAGKKMMIIFGCLLLLFAGLAFGAYWILGEAFGGCKNATFKEIMDMEDAATLADELKGGINFFPGHPPGGGGLVVPLVVGLLNNNSDKGLHLQDRDLHRRERAESRAAHLYRAQDVEAEGDPRVRLLALLKQAESQNSAEKFDASKCTIPLELEPRLVFVPLRETPFNPVQCEYLWLRKELVRVNDSAVIAACSAAVNHAHKSGKTTIYWTELSDEKGEDWNDTAEDSADEVGLERRTPAARKASSRLRSTRREDWS